MNQFFKNAKEFGKTALEIVSLSCLAGCAIGLAALLAGETYQIVVQNVYGWSFFAIIGMAIRMPLMMRQNHVAH